MSFHRRDGGGTGIFPKIRVGIPVGTRPRRDLVPMSGYQCLDSICYQCLDSISYHQSNIIQRAHTTTTTIIAIITIINIITIITLITMNWVILSELMLPLLR